MKKRLLVLAVVASVVCMNFALAANLLVNSSFEQTFTDEYNQVVNTATEGSYAYGGNGWLNNLPRWHSDENWGFGYNPNGTTSGGPFGLTVPSTAADGDIIYGAGNNELQHGVLKNQ